MQRQILRFAKVNRSFHNKSIRYFSESKQKQICIVGAGPAGFYAAQYIAKHLPDSHVDIIEKLPVPFGLVRFGVAPDHPEVKNVINTFTKTAENPRVRFLGNLKLGEDFSLSELRNCYHAVILSYGAEKDRLLNIPNENNNTVVSAREFVAWYNGLPGSEMFCPRLNESNISIIGQGNVAIDVARILLSPISVLKNTDITEYALEILSKSKVKRVYLVGRRGPLQAAFTIKELREMTKLSGVNVLWRKDDFIGIQEQIKDLPRPRKRITELMINSLSNQMKKDDEKEFLPIFLRSPAFIDDSNNVQLTINTLSGNEAIPTKETELLQTNYILRSIGYKSISLDSDINFNTKKGLVHNESGRVLKNDNNNDDNIKSNHENGLYVCGWLATGPTGVILTTMNNSFLVASNVCEDFASGAIDSTVPKPGIDLTKYNNVITWDGWKRIDKMEVELGKGIKPREKIVDISKMLEIAIV